ncbi:MAG: hypothetical protein MI725_15255 [Pirellulales bacterium]|nr:hypothetical protein [Pirellulales bacterium]
MATVAKKNLDHLRRWHCRKDHPIWFQRFSEKEQEHLVEDDLSAGYSVALVLVTVVTLGFVLVAGTVLLTWV